MNEPVSADRAVPTASRARTAAPALALLVTAAALLLCVLAQSWGYGLQAPLFGALALGLLGTAGWAAAAEDRALGVSRA